ncbi:MAG: ATP-binding protein [Pseudomonadota bacterium]
MRDSPETMHQKTDRIRALEVAAVMTSGKRFVPSYLVVVASFTLLIWRAMPLLTLIAWVGAYLLHITVRTIATKLYHQSTEAERTRNLRFWNGFVTGSAMAHGLIMGSLAVLAFPNLTPDARIGLTGMVFFICAASSTYVAALLKPLLLLISVAILPFVVTWWWFSGDPWRTTILFVAWILNCFLCWNHHTLLRRGWELLAHNEALARELEQKNLTLQESANARSWLFATASHDLRQPVHALGLTVAQLDEFDPPNVLRDRFDRLEDIATLLAEMLHELMDLNTLDRSDYVAVPEVVALQPLLDQLEKSLQPIAARKGLFLSMPAPSPACVHSDAKLLRRILLNLIANAIKYTTHGGVTVTSELRGNDLVVTVRDTGIGISDDQLDVIFGAYVSLSEPTGSDSDGAGLGLSIVRRAAERLGHVLTVRSEQGVGSNFEIAMLTAPDAHSRSPASGVPAACPGPQAPPAGCIVLLIEDDPHVLHALETLVDIWGFRAVGGRNAEEALGRLDHAAMPSAVVSDMHLQAGMNGLDAIEAVRSRLAQPALPALLMTGDMRLDLKAQASQRNIAMAIKPLSPVLLRETLLRLVRDHTAR